MQSKDEEMKVQGKSSLVHDKDFGNKMKWRCICPSVEVNHYCMTESFHLVCTLGLKALKKLLGFLSNILAKYFTSK